MGKVEVVMLKYSLLWFLEIASRSEKILAEFIYSSRPC